VRNYDWQPVTAAAAGIRHCGLALSLESSIN
jgi:hypothetical protein